MTLDGLYLNLLIGPAVPVPAPRELVEALTSAKVTASARGESGFELTFQLAPRSPLLKAFLLSGGSVPPVVRVVLFVTIGTQVEVLIDGVITDHQVQPGFGGKPSTLTITGSDLSSLMGWVRLDGIPYPALPPEARVALILSKYLVLGVIPAVVPRLLPDVPNPLKAIPRQKGTDLEYIRQLADEAGYVFAMEPGPAPGTSLAYWGPEVKVGPIQPSLSADMDAQSNVDSLSFRFNQESSTQYVIFIHEGITKLPIPIPIPNVSLLNPPLGLVPPIPKRFETLDTSKLSPVEAALRGLSRQAASAEAVTGTGSLNVARYGHVLKPRRLVGVRGAGEAFDGLYYVQTVTHSLSRGEFKQDFTISRNGLISTVSRVPA